MCVVARCHQRHVRGHQGGGRQLFMRKAAEGVPDASVGGTRDGAERRAAQTFDRRLPLTRREDRLERLDAPARAHGQLGPWGGGLQGLRALQGMRCESSPAAPPRRQRRWPGCRGGRQRTGGDAQDAASGMGLGRYGVGARPTPVQDDVCRVGGRVEMDGGPLNC